MKGVTLAIELIVVTVVDTPPYMCRLRELVVPALLKTAMAESSVVIAWTLHLLSGQVGVLPMASVVPADVPSTV